jgi:hypothetical protein
MRGGQRRQAPRIASAGNADRGARPTRRAHCVPFEIDWAGRAGGGRRLPTPASGASPSTTERRRPAISCRRRSQAAAGQADESRPDCRHRRIAWPTRVGQLRLRVRVRLQQSLQRASGAQATLSCRVLADSNESAARRRRRWLERMRLGARPMHALHLAGRHSGPAHRRKVADDERAAHASRPRMAPTAARFWSDGSRRSLWRALTHPRARRPARPAPSRPS